MLPLKTGLSLPDLPDFRTDAPPPSPAPPTPPAADGVETKPRRRALERTDGDVYIVLLSLHGLIRGNELELGRDADTGGQTKYVVELARALAEEPGVGRVDLITRLIEDPAVDDDYAQPLEQIGERANIIRIPFGPKKYLPKEKLWKWLSCFVDSALLHFHDVGRTPDVIHAHYADAGRVGGDIASLLGVPLVFTGHSLGHEKKRRLEESGMKPSTIESRFNITERIEAEERALSNASLVVASTHQEVETQYSTYDHFRKARAAVIPPGVDLDRFTPPGRLWGQPAVYDRIAKFLRNPRKPWILALSRADERKNIHTLLDAYGQSPELQEKANLVVVAGSRDDIEQMERGPRAVLTDMLLRIDRYALYGKIAYPKTHAPDEVPDIYRAAAKTRGVFINPALTEPFGLTLLEAAGSGLPLVATDDGGPRDILARLKNGLLIDPLDADKMAEALLDALSDSARWRRWSNAGVRLAHRHYAWSGHAKQYLRELRKIARRPRRKLSVSKSRLPQVDRILVSDIDNTLLGDAEGLAALKQLLEEKGERTAFAVATGRRIDSAKAVIAEMDAPQPDFWITSVGSEIHYGKQMTPDVDWTRNIHYRWDEHAVREALRRTPGLKLQPKIDQRGHKASFFIDPKKAPTPVQIEKLLREIGLRAKVIFSHGQFLDVLPVRASKGLAIRWVAHRWGVPMERVMVAGDSGNDEGMLAGKSLGLVVANYSPELEKLRKLERVHFASREYAWGIIEGIERYDFLGEIRQPD